VVSRPKIQPASIPCKIIKNNHVIFNSKGCQRLFNQRWIIVTAFNHDGLYKLDIQIANLIKHVNSKDIWHKSLEYLNHINMNLLK